MEIAEDEAAGGRDSPISQSSLESAQLTVGEAPGIAALESCKQFHSELIWFGVEPRGYFHPDILKRIFTGAPRSCWARFRRMSRADFPGLPRECETCKELGQVCVTYHRGMHPVPFGQRGKMMLHGTYLIEQTQGIQAIAEILKPRLDLRWDTFSGHQPRCRCSRSEVALDNLRAFAVFFGQLERRLKKINEEPSARI